MIGWIIGGLAIAWLLWGRGQRADTGRAPVLPSSSGLSDRVFGVGSHTDNARALGGAMTRIIQAGNRASVGGTDVGDGEVDQSPAMGLPNYLSVGRGGG